MITAIKAKVAAGVSALGVPGESLLVGLGDEGAGPVFNTITIDTQEMLLGQSWSGPASDPDAPEDGPVAALINLSTMAQIVLGMVAAMKPSFGKRTTAVATGGATTLLYDSVSVDSDLYAHAAGEFTVTHTARYELSVSLWGDSASDDTVVRVWLEVGGTEGDGMRTSITASATLTEGACHLTVSVDLTASDIVRVRTQKTVGTTFNIQRGSFQLRMVG